MKYKEEKLIELIKDIYGIDEVPDKATSRMEELIKEDLNPRGEALLSLRFGLEDGKNRTLQEIGNMFNLSSTRIGDLVKVTIKMLQHPKRREYVLTGVKSIYFGLSQAEYYELQKNRDPNFKVTPDTPIVHCPLTLTTINLLVGAEIYFVRDLANYCPEDLLRIKYFGIYRKNEVVKFVESTGVVKFKENDYIKAIFCDIDGVLNKLYSPVIIEKELVDRLKDIVSATNSEVIIISRVNDISRIKKIEEYGIKVYASIIDIKQTESKAHALVTYIQTNKISVNNFVVLDDHDDGYSTNFYRHFIKVNPKYGLMPKHVNEAIRILNR